MTNPTELSLDVDQLIPARPETVFRCLTEPELYAQWFEPDGATITVDEMHLALGGRLHLTIAFPGTTSKSASNASTKSSTAAVPRAHLARRRRRARHHRSLRPRTGRITNHLQIHHRGFVDPVDLEQNHGGWVDHLSKLSTVARLIEKI